MFINISNNTYIPYKNTYIIYKNKYKLFYSLSKLITYNNCHEHTYTHRILMSHLDYELSKSISLTLYGMILMC